MQGDSSASPLPLGEVDAKRRVRGYSLNDRPYPLTPTLSQRERERFRCRQALLDQATLLRHPDLAEIFQHAGMDQLQARRRGGGIRGRGFAGLRQLLAERAFDAMQR